MPNEIELKLRIQAADIPRLRRHPALRRHLADKPVTRHLVSTYFDTLDLKLLAHDISLRVRRMSGGWFQAVKATGHSLAGLHQRMEWEDVINKASPDFSKITEPALASIFADQALRDALKPIFVTDVRRTEWQLQFNDGSAIEVALDLGELRVQVKPEAAEPIIEIELELKHGNAQHLFELALALQADIPLHIENVSKAQRGYAYYHAALPNIAKAEDIELNPKASTDEAFRQIVGECLRQLQSNEDIVLHGDDIEGVHQMRVALRRLNTASRVFRQKSASLKDELDWLGGLLGAARNWDVLCRETLPDVLESMGKIDSFELLMQRCKAAQQHAYTDLKSALVSQRYQRLLLSLGAWLESAQVPGPVKIGNFATRALRRQFKPLTDCKHDLNDLNAYQRHKIRIKAKHMRYAAEFFLSLYDSKKAQRHWQDFMKTLTDLQKSLGLLNDMATSEMLLHSLLSGRYKCDLEPICNLVLAWNAGRSAHGLSAANKSWRVLRQADTFWD